MTLTLQQAYDKAKNGVIAQGALANTVGRGCMYLIPDTDLKCGVGQLLADDDMRLRWDDKAWTACYIHDEARDLPDQLLKDMNTSGIIDLDKRFLHELQNTHDDASGLSDFLSWMHQLAFEWDLTP